MSEGLVTMAYLVSGIFILSLGGLSKQETASREKYLCALWNDHCRTGDLL